jgi:transposase
MGVHLDGSSKGRVSRLEVLEGPSGRRQRSRAERARIALESLRSGASVAEVARIHGVTRWQVYDWRRQLKVGLLTVPEEVATLPAFATLVVDAAAGTPSADCPTGSDAPIEIMIGDMVVRAGSVADQDHLVRVLRAVRRAAGESMP